MRENSKSEIFEKYKTVDKLFIKNEISKDEAIDLIGNDVLIKYEQVEA